MGFPTVNINLLIIFLHFLLVSCSQLPPKRSDKISIVQGITNSKEVEFSILTRVGRAFRFELRSEDGKIIFPEETKTISRDYSDYVIHKIIFERDPSKIYNLFILEANKIVDQRLVGRGQRKESKLRIAVASCMSDYFSDHFKIWDVLAQKNPEYLLMIGDNVYADQTSHRKFSAATPKDIWERYIDARLSYPIFFQKKLIPIHAIWDDHDYGINNGNSDFKYRKESQEIFEAFFAQDLSDDDWTKALGLGGLLSLGDFNLYFLDGRSFRSQESTGPHLGLEQTDWLYTKLKEEMTPSLIIKGDQFFGGYHPFESFEGQHPENFQEFIDELKKISTPFIFISGDRHMSEIMQFPRGLFGKPSFEITSSPIHAKTFGADSFKNPWQVIAEKDHLNFVIIDNLAKDNHWFMDVESYGENGELFFKRELSVYIKDLQDNLIEQRKRRTGKRRYRKLRSRKKSRR
jgi:hypothetical protein